MVTPYMQQLLENDMQHQTAIEQLLLKYKVQPVGVGYIDLILPKGDALALIKELAQLPVAVESLSWWCLCTQQSKATLGCPHGMGGPPNLFGEGWFSECVQYPIISVSDQGVDLDSISVEPGQLANECGQVLCNYIENVLPVEGFYSECLHPGLWLYVPQTWKRRNYFVK